MGFERQGQKKPLGPGGPAVQAFFFQAVIKKKWGDTENPVGRGGRGRRRLFFAGDRLLRQSAPPFGPGSSWAVFGDLGAAFQLACGFPRFFLERSFVVWGTAGRGSLFSGWPGRLGLRGVCTGGAWAPVGRPAEGAHRPKKHRGLIFRQPMNFVVESPLWPKSGQHERFSSVWGPTQRLAGQTTCPNSNFSGE